jgi:hypothetical protein
MLPRISIPLNDYIIFLNVNVCIITIILACVYRRYSKYILKVYKIDDSMHYQQNFYKRVSNICSMILIVTGLILAIRVDSI